MRKICVIDWQSYPSLCDTLFSVYSMIRHYGFYPKRMIRHYVIHHSLSFQCVTVDWYHNIIVWYFTAVESISYYGMCTTTTGQMTLSSWIWNFTNLAIMIRICWAYDHWSCARIFAFYEIYDVKNSKLFQGNKCVIN